ncbi:MAG: site-specific integrase [Chloroflexota bacterium]|nr:site-specific integrase [Dehalococcoidia bacterium]MDW8047287.1 site-specific integrase [Chloroflexota bacterium]
MARKRRPKGQGTIHRDATGRYHVYVYVGGRRLHRVLRTKEEAEAVRRQLVSRRMRAAYVSNPHQRLADYLEAWLGELEKTAARNTWENYRSTCRRHIIPYLGRRRLIELEPADVAELLAVLQEHEGVQVAKYTATVLRVALKRAISLGLLPNTEDDAVTRALRGWRWRRKASSTAGRPLEPAEFARLLAATEDARLRAAWLLGGVVGLRLGELLGLEWNDVDLEAGQLTVRRQRGDAGRTFPPKTASSEQPIPLPGSVLEALRAWRRLQAEERLAAGPAWEGGDYVLTASTGRPMSADALRKAFRHCLAQAGLEPRRFHDLRHGAATWLVTHGVPPNVAAKMLRHANPTVTLRVYAAHAPEAQVRAAADALDGLVRGESNK